MTEKCFVQKIAERTDAIHSEDSNYIAIRGFELCKCIGCFLWRMIATYDSLMVACDSLIGAYAQIVRYVIMNSSISTLCSDGCVWRIGRVWLTVPGQERNSSVSLCDVGAAMLEIPLTIRGTLVNNAHLFLGLHVQEAWLFMAWRLCQADCAIIDVMMCVSTICRKVTYLDEDNLPWDHRILSRGDRRCIHLPNNLS